MRFAIAIILGLGFALAESLPSWAQSCTTSQVQGGKLGLVSGNATALSSRPDQAPLGQLATWTVTCTAGMALNVSPPIALGSTPATVARGVQVWNGSPLSGGTLLTEATTIATNINLSAPINNRTFFLHLYANSGATPLISGTYSYRVPFLVVPQ